MAKLAVIGAFYGRHEQSRECVKRVLESTRVPDVFWVVCETQEDADNLKDFAGVKTVVLPTPMENGDYKVIPYSLKLNYALDCIDADLYCYLDNGSLPHPDKYRQLAEALEDENKQAVYCTQHRTGFIDFIHKADKIVEDPYCVINFTQAMHRPTDARWTLDMQYARPDHADALFFRKTGFTFYPVGSEILDIHKMESDTI